MVRPCRGSASAATPRSAPRRPCAGTASGSSKLVPRASNQLDTGTRSCRRSKFFKRITDASVPWSLVTWSVARSLGPDLLVFHIGDSRADCVATPAAPPTADRAYARFSSTAAALRSLTFAAIRWSCAQRTRSAAQPGTLTSTSISCASSDSPGPAVQRQLGPYAWTTSDGADAEQGLRVRTMRARSSSLALDHHRATTSQVIVRVQLHAKAEIDAAPPRCGVRLSKPSSD